MKELLDSMTREGQLTNGSEMPQSTGTVDGNTEGEVNQILTKTSTMTRAPGMLPPYDAKTHLETLVGEKPPPEASLISHLWYQKRQRLAQDRIIRRFQRREEKWGLVINQYADLLKTQNDGLMNVMRSAMDILQISEQMVRQDFQTVEGELDEKEDDLKDDHPLMDNE